MVKDKVEGKEFIFLYIYISLKLSLCNYNECVNGNLRLLIAGTFDEIGGF